MEETDYFFSSELEEDSKVWVVGLLLKSCSRSDGSGDMGSEYERYERVGCLRYFTDRTKREFVPRGRKAEFELV